MIRADAPGPTRDDALATSQQRLVESAATVSELNAVAASTAVSAHVGDSHTRIASNNQPTLLALPSTYLRALALPP